MKKIVFLVFLIIFQNFEAKKKQKTKDFYEILGVRRNADKKQIKKAYKKLVKKYHPDNNKERQNWAKKQFIEITKAYETLTDPEKRRIYDMGGEEAVDDAEQKQNQGQGQGFNGGTFDFGGGGFGGGGFEGFNFEDIFASAFGGGGGGKRRQQRGRGGRRRQQNNFHFEDDDQDDFQYGRQKQRKQIDLTECSNFISLQKSIFPNLKKLKETWNVFFYEKETYDVSQYTFVKDFCEKFGDNLKIAGVDCSQQKEFCKELGIQQTPKFRIYYGDERKIDITLYQGLKLQFVVRQNINLMPKQIVKLTVDNYKEKVQEYFGKPFIILFTKRKESSLLYRSLANQYVNKIVFAEIHYQNELIEKFQIKEFPHLMLITDPLNYKGISFNEKISKGNILHFINQNAQSKKEEIVMEFSQDRINLGNCGSKDKNICLVTLIDEKDLQKTRQILGSIKDKYRSDNVSVYYLKKGKINLSQFQNQFGKNNILFLRGKKNKYLGMEENIISIDKSMITGKIDNMLGGVFGPMEKYSNLLQIFKQLILIKNLFKKIILIFKFKFKMLKYSNSGSYEDELGKFITENQQTYQNIFNTNMKQQDKEQKIVEVCQQVKICSLIRK